MENSKVPLMNKSTLTQSKFLLTLIAGLALSVGLPMAADAGSYDGPPIKQLKVKDHKVKVKVAGGTAKFKTKRNGKEKIKITGPNGQLAAQIAANAQAPNHAPTPYYGK